MRSTCVRALIGLIAAALVFPAVAAAKANIHIGKLEIVPGIEYQGEFNDNVFLDSEDEKDDYIHHLIPSLGLNWEQDEDNYVRLGYEADVVRYSDYDDTDYEKHTVTGKAAYESPAGFYAKLNERFVDTADPYGSEDDYNTGEQTERWNNRAGATLGYKFGDRIRTEVSYKNYIQKYDAFEDQWRDQIDHEPGVAMFYRFLPKTSALVEYRYQSRTYTEQQDADDNSKGIEDDTAQDFDYHKAFVGLHWDASAKIIGDLKLGLGYKDYENDENWDGNAYDDNTTWLAETRLFYKLTRKTMISGTLLREVRDSASDDGSTEYENTTVGVGVKQKVLRQLTLSGYLDYTAKEYDENADGEERSDDVYAAELGAEYTFNDWLTAGLNYTFKDKQSNFEDKEYTENIVGVSLSASY